MPQNDSKPILSQMAQETSGWFSASFLLGTLHAVLALVAVLAVPVSAQPPNHIFERLPISTVAAVVTSDAELALENLQKIGSVSVLSGPEFRPFINALRKTQPLLDPVAVSPLPWQRTVDLLSGGGFALAVIEVDDQLPEVSFLLEMKGNKPEWEKLLAEHLSDLERQGRISVTKQLDGVNITIITATPTSKPLAIMMLDDLVIVCQSEGAAKQWIAASQDESTESRLSADSRYVKTLGKLADVEDQAGQVWFFVEPLRADYLRARGGGWTESEIARTFGARNGFDGVRAMGGWALLGQSDLDARYHFRIWAPQPRRLGMKLLDFQSLSNASPSPWVPVTNVSSYATLGWNLQPILENLGPLVDEVVEDVTGKSDQTLERFLDQLAADDGPGIDLQNDLMPLLGQRIEYINIFTPPASETSERSLVALELNQSLDNVEADVADIIELLVDAGDTLDLKIPSFAYPLWKLGSGQRAGGGPSFSTPGVMVANGRLFIASDYKVIHDYVAVKQPVSSLAAKDEFEQVESFMNETAGSGPAIRVVAFPAEDFENTYELLRTGRVDRAESIYMLLLSPLLAANKDVIPFEQLPNFRNFKKTLGPVGIQLNVLGDGWDLQGVNFRTKR